MGADELAMALATPDQLGALLVALNGLRRGDVTVRLPIDWPGISGKVADVFNDVVDQNAAMASELARLRQVVGKEGKLKQRASMRDARGFWGESIDCVNALSASQFVRPPPSAAHR